MCVHTYLNGRHWQPSAMQWTLTYPGRSQKPERERRYDSHVRGGIGHVTVMWVEEWVIMRVQWRSNYNKGEDSQQSCDKLMVHVDALVDQRTLFVKHSSKNGRFPVKNETQHQLICSWCQKDWHQTYLSLPPRVKDYQWFLYCSQLKDKNHTQDNLPPSPSSLNLIPRLLVGRAWARDHLHAQTPPPPPASYPDSTPPTHEDQTSPSREEKGSGDYWALSWLCQVSSCSVGTKVVRAFVQRLYECSSLVSQIVLLGYNRGSPR